ncbi:MAG: helix-turn-helix transcriptional regulator [Clostridia bacterium]|nr:helix-turn-helix transcriptional regulator [Clostridia bacterium]
MMWIFENRGTVVSGKKSLMELLRCRRKELGLTQIELASKTQSSQKQISCYESNVQVPTVGKFLSVCEALDLEVVLKRKEEEKIIEVPVEVK